MKVYFSLMSSFEDKILLKTGGNVRFSTSVQKADILNTTSKNSSLSA